MKSLSARLTFWYALVVTFTVAVLLFVGRFYLEHSLISGIDLLNAVEFEEISSRIDNAGTAESQHSIIASIKEHAELDAELYFFQIGKADGEILYRSGNLGPCELPKAVHGQPRATIKDDELGWIRSMEVSYAGLDIHIVSSLNSVQTLFKDYTQISLYALIAVFALSLFLGYFLSRLAIRPIASIQTSAQRVTASSFSERIPVPNTGDEVARMAILLNAMLDRLERSYQQVKRFTAEASHEFRTPLSIIRLQTERMLAQPELAESERELALCEQMEEVERLNKMIDDLLFLAKADAGAMPLAIKSVSLSEFLQEFTTDVVLLAQEFGVRFELSQSVEGDWFFDARWIRQVLLNLVSNALRVSQAGQLVQLIVDRQETQLRMRVIDQGTGVSEAQLELMFNRFERLNQPSEITGNGLGLAICKSIIEQHAGNIHAYNRVDCKGLVVEFTLPAHGNADDQA